MKVVYDGINHALKIFADDGTMHFYCEAHNDSVADNAWRADAGCPPGTYSIGEPEACDPGYEQTSMGYWFTPLYNIPDHAGIGIHGGGSCSSDPLAPHQGWCPTENCIRVQNADNTTFTEAIRGKTPLEIEVVQSL